MEQSNALASLSTVLVALLAGSGNAQQARFTGARLPREKALLLGTAGATLPEGGALGPFADLDGDARVDLLSDEGSCLGTGYGQFLPARPLAIAAERRLGLFQADADGSPDLLTRTHFYLGDGTGGFVDASAGLPPGFAADAAVFADLDQDLDLDIAWVRRFASPLPALAGVARNDGSGVFTNLASGVPATPLGAFTLVAGDVDADGDADLVLATGALDELWLNDGSGQFTAASGALPPVSDETRALALADLDGDLDLDLVLANDALNGGPGTRLVWNDGAGGFSAGVLPAPASPRRTDAVLVLDREGDGDADLVLLEPLQLDFPATYDAPNRLLVNDGSGGFSASADLPVSDGASHAGFAGDLDGDGDPDLVLEDAHGNRILLGDGQGAFVPASEARFPFADEHDLEARVVALGDLDGDGLMDVFTAQEIFHASLAGRLAPLGATLPAMPVHCLDILGLERAFDVALGDVDGDGDLDAYLAGPGLGECGGTPLQSNRLWINDGEAGFADESAARLPQAGQEIVGNPVRVLLLALDGDGDLDAACIRSKDRDGSGDSSCYLNDGSGHFTRKESMSAASFAGAFGDLDGDGDADYFEGADNFFPSNGAHLNDGSAHFVASPAAVPAHAHPLYAYACVLSDVDTDGDLDAYLACAGPPASFLYLNDGTAHFVDEPERMPVSLADWPTRNQVLATDLDLDGDDDLLTAQRLFLNDGEGFFAEAQDRTRPWATGARLAVGDLDLDGDPDVVSVDSVQLTVAVGFARHLESLGPARIGKRQRLTLHGQPRAPYTLLESTRPLRAPLGAMGWLLVDPSRIVGVTSGFLDGRGEAPFRRMLPPDPALIGRTSYGQAFVGQPAHATNLLVMPITGL